AWAHACSSWAAKPAPRGNRMCIPALTSSTCNAPATKPPVWLLNAGLQNSLAPEVRAFSRRLPLEALFTNRRSRLRGARIGGYRKGIAHGAYHRIAEQSIVAQKHLAALRIGISFPFPHTCGHAYFVDIWFSNGALR